MRNAACPVSTPTGKLSPAYTRRHRPTPRSLLFPRSRAYCSDECESQDITSPSISTTSSAHPSPFLRSSHNTPSHLAEVPALLPSALGQSFGARKPSHRVRHSESSSSNSSTSWSPLDDEHEEDSASFAIYGANTDDEYYAVNPDYADPSKLSPGYAHHASSLAYARRRSFHHQSSFYGPFTTPPHLFRLRHDGKYRRVPQHTSRRFH